MVGTGAQLCAMVSVTLGEARLFPPIFPFFPLRTDPDLFANETVFALFGFLSPSNRGSLATVLLISWTLFGLYVPPPSLSLSFPRRVVELTLPPSLSSFVRSFSVAGYVSNVTYTSLDGKDFKRVGFATATLFPCIIFIVIFLLDLFLVGAGSSGAVPIGTILAVVALWFLISVPLNVAGTYFGMRHGVSFGRRG